MALSSDDIEPLVLVVNDSVPPREAWNEISRRAACGAFAGQNVLTYLLVRNPDQDDDGFRVPIAFHTETVQCDAARASIQE